MSAAPSSRGIPTQLDVSREHHGASLLDFLDAVAGPLDRRLVNRAARDEQLKLNGEPAGPSVTLKSGDVVDVEVPLEQLGRRQDERLALVHEDERLQVLAKPSGLPFDASRSSSGASALERLADAPAGGGRPRAVHRLDKDTSGLVLLARDGASEETLLAALASGEARVEYLAMIRGKPAGPEGEIDVPLGKRRKSDAQLVPDPKHGRPLCTRYRTEQRFRGFTWLRLWSTENGRSHQIRAHLAAAGHPALGDALYGEDDRLLLSQLKLGYRPKRGRPERPLLQRPAVHAATFRWGELVVEAPLPDELGVLLAQLGRVRPLRATPTDGGDGTDGED